MTLRTKKYIGRKNAINEIIRFKDLGSFLKASFQMSKSIIVKKDILSTLSTLSRRQNAIAA